MFLESLDPRLQLESVPSHDDHNHDDQEAQEYPLSGHLKENRCLDGIFLIYTQHNYMVLVSLQPGLQLLNKKW